MKKTILISLCVALGVAPAMANYYGFRTGNCNPASMHAELDRAVRSHKTVITEVVCDAPVPHFAPVYSEPAYVVEYVPVVMDVSSIPVVDCVPGPIACGC